MYLTKNRAELGKGSPIIAKILYYWDFYMSSQNIICK